MLSHIAVDIKNLSVLGKNFKWKRPKCPKGCKKVWGHGFVLRYFSSFKQGVYLKRYRCPTCGTVITMFPIGYWKHQQSSIENIYFAIKARLTSYRWPSWTTRQRAGHWIKKFYSFLIMNFSNDLSNPLQVLEQSYVKKLLFLGQDSESLN